MADVKTVDIDGSQWIMKDEVARNKITTIVNNQIPIALEDIPITLNSGYTASSAKFFSHHKVGKIHFAIVSIENIEGNKIGTTETAYCGTIPFKAFEITSFILFDYINAKIARCFIDKVGNFSIGESNGVVQGNNHLYGEAIWVEKE